MHFGSICLRLRMCLMALWRRRRRRRRRRRCRCHQHYITHGFERHSNTKNTSSPVVRCGASRYQTVGTSPIVNTTLFILSKNHLYYYYNTSSSGSKTQQHSSPLAPLAQTASVPQQTHNTTERNDRPPSSNLFWTLASTCSLTFSLYLAYFIKQR